MSTRTLRAAIAAALLFAGVLGGAATAAAQTDDDTVAFDDDDTLVVQTAEQQQELDSINTLADWGTALYIGGGVSFRRRDVRLRLGSQRHVRPRRNGRLLPRHAQLGPVVRNHPALVAIDATGTFYDEIEYGPPASGETGIALDPSSMFHRPDGVALQGCTRFVLIDAWPVQTWEAVCDRCILRLIDE